jgi:hypothetical protein
MLVRVYGCPGPSMALQMGYCLLMREPRASCYFSWTCSYTWLHYTHVPSILARREWRVQLRKYCNWYLSQSCETHPIAGQSVCLSSSPESYLQNELRIFLSFVVAQHVRTDEEHISAHSMCHIYFWISEVGQLEDLVIPWGFSVPPLYGETPSIYIPNFSVASNPKTGVFVTCTILIGIWKSKDIPEV